MKQKHMKQRKLPRILTFGLSLAMVLNAGSFSVLAGESDLSSEEAVLAGTVQEESVETAAEQPAAPEKAAEVKTPAASEESAGSEGSAGTEESSEPEESAGSEGSAESEESAGTKEPSAEPEISEKPSEGSESGEVPDGKQTEESKTTGEEEAGGSADEIESRPTGIPETAEPTGTSEPTEMPEHPADSEGDSEEPKPTETPAPEIWGDPDFISYNAVICEDLVPVYEKSEAGSKVLAQAAKGSSVQVLNEQDDWAQIRIGELTGFVKKEQIAPARDEPAKSMYLTSELPEKLEVGEKVILRCVTEGYEEGSYTLQWQYRSIDWFGAYTGETDQPGATEAEFSFELNSDTVLRAWRVVLTEQDSSDME